MKYILNYFVLIYRDHSVKVHTFWCEKLGLSMYIMLKVPYERGGFPFQRKSSKQKFD